jgi:DNA-binding CsgD family transcriptional regulator
MALDDTDIRAVFDATTVLISDPVPPIESVLDLLRSLIPCSSASFNDMAFVSGDFRYTIVPPDDEALAERLKPEYDRYAHQHPLIAQAQLRPGGGAIRFCDVPCGDAVTDTDLYRNFFEPFDIRYQLAIQLPAPPDVLVGYALNRSGRLGEFSDRDVGVLNALGPHLTLHHRVTMDRERSRAVTAEADRDGWVVVTVRSDGIVQGSSSTTFSASLTPGGSLPPAVAALLPGNGTTPAQASTHDVEVGDEQWRCVVNPVAVGPTVLLVRRLGDETGGATALVDLGLTPRQAEVAIALAGTGGTNSQLAGQLGISEGTVKKHLESVFRVLSVDSRAAAIVALGELVGGNR